MSEFSGYNPEHTASPERTERVIASLAGTIYEIIREELFVDLSVDVRANNRRLPLLENIISNDLSSDLVQKYLTETELQSVNMLELCADIKNRVIEKIKNLLLESYPLATSAEERHFIKRCVATIEKKYDQKDA